MSLCINLYTVEIGKNNNHLIFTGYALNNECKFDYCGTELICLKGNLLDSIIEELRKNLYKDFGTVPFNISMAKQTLQNKGSYQINSKKIKI